MLSDGLYGVDFRTLAEASDAIGSGLAVLRDGKILGTDQRGGVFMGDYRYDKDAGAGCVDLRLRVPPEGELITGFAAGSDGATIDVVAAVDDLARLMEATVEVAGAPVAVRLTYIGPLPN